jgi:hypothetical protein
MRPSVPCNNRTIHIMILVPHGGADLLASRDVPQPKYFVARPEENSTLICGQNCAIDRPVMPHNRPGNLAARCTI